VIEFIASALLVVTLTGVLFVLAVFQAAAIEVRQRKATRVIEYRPLRAKAPARPIRPLRPAA
jgi:hypothetical protein